ncbi:MAG: glycosyltransferase [Chlamydiia bacterium]|nr:glycosyltransferase [Chlamydiia bacterium]
MLLDPIQHFQDNSGIEIRMPSIHMMKRPRILVASFSDLSRDPRVSRQITHLIAQGYAVSSLGEASPKESIPFACSSVPSNAFTTRLYRASLLSLGAYERFYWSHPRIQKCLRDLEHEDFDLVIANDLDTLPLALQLARKAPVLFDAHEYAPRESEDLIWRLLINPYRSALCRRYLPLCRAMLTVSQGIAEEYQRVFGIGCGVMTNAPRQQELYPQPLQRNRIRMIYHGVIDPGRGVEDIFRIMDRLDDRFHLDMIMIPSSKTSYLQRMEVLAEEHPRVRLIPRVEPDQIPKLCNQYDVGFYPLAASSFNNQHALPNKFFEFIQARVAVITTRLPEMTRYLQQHGCGASFEMPVESFAASMNRLETEEIWQMKLCAHRAAGELCAERNLKDFQRLVESLI